MYLCSFLIVSVAFYLFNLIFTAILDRRSDIITSVLGMLNYSLSDLPEAQTASFVFEHTYFGERLVYLGSCVLLVVRKKPLQSIVLLGMF